MSHPLIRCLLPLLAATLTSAVHVASAQPKANITRNPIEVDPQEYLSRIELPPGFRIEIFADGVRSARSMALAPGGTLFVGSRTDINRNRIGKVYAIPTDEEGAGEVMTLAEGLNVPNGVALKDGDLYVAEIHRVLRYPGIEDNLASPPEPQVVGEPFPDEYHHGWKFIRFGPDERLYVPVGAPCNVCLPNEGQGTIVSMAADGSDRRIFAHGIRNSVGFDWHPDTDELWFTDNGRDIWGDDIPPEELNHAPEEGMHFGFPHRYGKTLVDEEFPTDAPAADFAPAALEFPAHNALLGIRFYSGTQFPRDFQGRLFIASHGSWNRSIPDGYRIYSVRMEGGKAVEFDVFADGWLTPDQEFWGRPVDIEFMPDGSMLVSDDFADVIYRISYDPALAAN